MATLRASGKRPSALDILEPQVKRQRMDNMNNNGLLASLDRAVSPPPLRRKPSSIASQAPAIDETNGDIFIKAYLKDRQNQAIKDVDIIDLTDEGRVLFDDSMTNARVDREKQEEERLKPESQEKKGSNRFVTGQGQTKRLPSPFQLTLVRDLPDSDNVDTIRIHDILGDVMIKGAWIFNFLIDVDWVMDQFDPDIKDIVDVKIVHGSWRKQDGNITRLEEQANRYHNVKIISAYMPEPFGTHHTKMIVLFRHDELAQVIIHTSNMIEFDWTNMTQAVWRSPLLPLMSIQNSPDAPVPKPRLIGESFKNDLLAYLRAYGKSRVSGLYDKLGKYSFQEVRAVFVASVPGKYQLNGRGAGERWGWMGLERVLSNIPLSNNHQHDKDGDKGRIVLQVSSIATLGSMDTWLSPVLYKALSAARNTTKPSSGSILAKKPKLSIIFPTAHEVRSSLNGYASGQAIHIRIQTKAQDSQLRYLRPFLCHWDPYSDPSFVQSPSLTNQINSTHSGRTRAAPHIKTYIRFTDQTCRSIEWAMLSSANLSTQAWGTARKNSSAGFLGPGQGEVKISSYEVGVLIYPGLFKDSDEENVEIIPVFKKDTPDVSIDNSKDVKVIGLRMPYDLPIRPYGKDDVPWCGSKSYAELDWRGRSWEI
ncbi:tyrosyl-DNA phosphodiesterase-domain-containing protein [Morchella snyderi]|nr:tyrosyl-DNA phosphodiesterase-domain-containing protein [Morchella snyderi]